MSQYNSTTTTTGTPLNATTAKGNRTSSQKSTSPRLPTTTITHTTKMTTGIYNRESHKDTDMRIMIIGICTAAILLIVISLVVVLVILKKRRDQKDSTENIESGKKKDQRNSTENIENGKKNNQGNSTENIENGKKKDQKNSTENIENGRKNNNIALKHSSTIMNEITNAVAKRQKCIREEEYDDVVSSDKDKDDTAQSDDMTDKEEYEYVMVKRTSPQPYTILGPRDSPDAYERMKKTNSDQGENSPYSTIKYKDCTANQGADLETRPVYENQVEIIKDGYIVPITNRENRSPSEGYIEVLS